ARSFQCLGAQSIIVPVDSRGNTTRHNSVPLSLSSATIQASDRVPSWLRKCQTATKTVSPARPTPGDPERFGIVGSTRQTHFDLPVLISSALTLAPHAGMKTVLSSAAIRLLGM